MKDLDGNTPLVRASPPGVGAGSCSARRRRRLTAARPPARSHADARGEEQLGEEGGDEEDLGQVRRQVSGVPSGAAAPQQRR